MLLLVSGCGRHPPALVADVAPAPASKSAPALPSAVPAPSAASAVSATSAPSAAAAEPATRRRFAGGGPGSVSGRRGIVTSSEAQATHAGVEILERGGNAVDAAVATAIDFRETAPDALTRPGFDRMQLGGAKGGAAVGVPGSVAGLLLAHERFGKLPRQDLLAPAVALAKSGCVLGRRQAELLAASYEVLKSDKT